VSRAGAFSSVALRNRGTLGVWGAEGACNGSLPTAAGGGSTGNEEDGVIAKNGC